MLRRFWSIPILTYHRIGKLKGDHVPTVSLKSFEAQLRFIHRHRYRVWRLDELVEAMSQGQPIEQRSTVITFDDGYEEIATVVVPLLQRMQTPATAFIAPAEVGRSGFMTWGQVRAIARDGMTIGSHTMNHIYLPFASVEQIRRELAQSKQILEQQLGQSAFLLSYPVGGFTVQIQQIAKALGYRAACTTNRGTARVGHDLFALRRIKMTERDRHPVSLTVKLSGYYDFFRRLEEPA